MEAISEARKPELFILQEFGMTMVNKLSHEKITLLILT